MQRRVLGLDVGEKRIGVAVSDLLGLTAQGVETIDSKGQKRDLERVDALCKQYDAAAIVVGLPKNMDGTEGFQAGRVRAFGDALAATGHKIVYQDERLTTASARNVLIEANVSRQKRKGVIDKMAAGYILQGFLDSGKLPTIANDEQEDGNMEGYMDSENIVELVDEAGDPVKFEHLMTLDYEGASYALLAPIDDIDGIGDDEVIVLKIETEDDEDVYVGVEDEDLLEKVFARYLELAEADEDELEAEEDKD